MKKLSKAILIALGAVLALVIAVLFGVNLYIQSPGVQTRIQEEISRSLRVPLRITNTSVTPWSDLRITGITIPGGETNLLEAAAFNARYRLLPIFSGTLVIYGMNVDSPKIVWAQNAEGKWELPKAAPVVAPPAPPAASPSAAPASTVAETPAREEKGPAPQSKARGGFHVVVEGFEIKNGQIELLDTAGQRVATFADVHMIYTTLTPERIEGTATIGRIVWKETLAFENVSTPFNYTPEILDLPQIGGTLGGGPVSGSFHLKAKEPNSPFALGLKFGQVDLARVASDAGWGEGQASGALGGTLDLEGDISHFARAEGTAQLTLQNGRFKEFSYFEMIGQALQIKQLSDLRLKDSSATARIADEKVHFETLTLDASDLSLSAKGIARFDGKLDLAARLNAQNSLIKQLPGLVRDNFKPGDNETHYIDFKITGKTAKPKTDLFDKIVGKKLEAQFDDLVNSLFGSKKKKEPEKPKPDEKKKDEEEKPATPSPPPASTNQ